MLLFTLAFAALSCILISSLWHARKQEGHMLSRIEELTNRRKHLSDEFTLKQDYMRKIANDGEFVEQLIREKTGFSKQNEIIFRFED
ncbi:MAG: septum formation initiator family protein [Puniceicoccales bacterium]|jgi:cell division protein FtsB|nr:septum formation initiator family protein [Puniceicoccales bacterium]